MGDEARSDRACKENSSRPRALAAVYSWAVWQLPVGLRAYVLGLPALAVVLAVALVVAVPPRAGDLLLFAVLLGGGAASVEATRRLGEPTGVAARDLLTAWWLPAAVLLPPVYALLLPAPLAVLTQWRVRRSVLHRRVLSAAAVGLAYAAAAAGMRALPGDGTPGGPAWLAAALSCGAAAVTLNAVLVGAAVRAADPQVRWRDLWSRDDLKLDAVELCTGCVVTVLLGHSLLLVAVALPPVLLLQRGLLHDQLTAAARTDPKTGLLNAVTWEREAAGELARAARSRRPSAVLLVDLDHFKRVNDTHGHLAGDHALRGVADALRGQIRDGDLLGRFGGEEFAVLLVGADEREAARVAERIRAAVADLRVAVPGGAARLTASVGAAVVTGGATVIDALAAADERLYGAKAAGRDQVQLGQLRAQVQAG